MIQSSRVSVPLLTVLAVLLLCASFGCAPKRLPGVLQPTPEAAWQSFRQNYARPPKSDAVLVKASLYYSRIKPVKRTNRTVVSLWGDLDGTMRLDVAAGVGRLLAHIRENKEGLLAFYPGENKAYAHMNPILGATRLGMPFPFSLSELGSVIMNDYSGLVPKKYGEARQEDENYVYDLNGGLVSSVVLDQTGRPILLEGRTTKAYETAREWRLEINTYEESSGRGAPRPGRLTLSLDNGEKGVLRIKSRESKKSPWTAKSLALELPDNVELYRLDNGLTKVTQEGPGVE